MFSVFHDNFYYWKDEIKKLYKIHVVRKRYAIQSAMC